MTTTIIYHQNCADGFAAALCAKLALQGTQTLEFLPWSYSMTHVPPVKGSRVFILDFSFPPEVLAQLEDQVSELVLLDHHKTAQESLKGYRCRCAKLHFDLGKSGARLAWEYFHPGKEVPKLIRYVEDRDLWRWAYPDTADYLAALDMLGFDNFDAWEQVLRMSEAEDKDFTARGAAMNEKMQYLCDEIAKNAYPVSLFGTTGLAVGAPSLFSSDVGARLAAKSGTFGLIWNMDTPSRVKVSLRSVAPFDVSALAVRLGGGGHPQASSFYLLAGRLFELLEGRIE